MSVSARSVSTGLSEARDSTYLSSIRKAFPESWLAHKSSDLVRVHWLAEGLRCWLRTFVQQSQVMGAYPNRRPHSFWSLC